MKVCENQWNPNKILEIFIKSEIFWILATAFVFLCKNPERQPHPDSVSLRFPVHKNLQLHNSRLYIGAMT